MACVTRTAEIGKSDTHPLFQSNVRVSHVTDECAGPESTRANAWHTKCQCRHDLAALKGGHIVACTDTWLQPARKRRRIKSSLFFLRS
ncbi:hypothetical protein PC116_g20263 [Phytophthora cactorum]|nr:hypothetical protein Pcac1_g26748 [Phytophthora cactorum]KAG2904778.1 hypothetical protein PC114_g11756 [Phytophthora cactorum]KAG3005642.1 hypothetical protein PC119_g15236 [Phytophthora cactorum]KAG3007031.1 hypothetical protein PC120_g17039 [Phytophthora cactorum]KAG3146602.1 hypothetical protein C6341_g17981 [Phytophthora cactorum]